MVLREALKLLNPNVFIRLWKHTDKDFHCDKDDGKDIVMVYSSYSIRKEFNNNPSVLPAADQNIELIRPKVGKYAQDVFTYHSHILSTRYPWAKDHVPLHSQFAGTCDCDYAYSDNHKFYVTCSELFDAETEYPEYMDSEFVQFTNLSYPMIRNNKESENDITRDSNDVCWIFGPEPIDIIIK